MVSERVYWRGKNSGDIYNFTPRQENYDLFERVHILTDAELAAERAQIEQEVAERIADVLRHIKCRDAATVKNNACPYCDALNLATDTVEGMY